MNEKPDPKFKVGDKFLLTSDPNNPDEPRVATVTSCFWGEYTKQWRYRHDRSSFAWSEDHLQKLTPA